MKTAIIIHGSYTNPEANWYPWVKQQLQTQGYEVFVPHFPTPQHQSLMDWEAVFVPYEKNINEETLIIAHSVGCAFVLRQLARMDHPVAGCVFVAPFTDKIEHEGLNFVDATFITNPFDWHAIHANVGKAVVIGSQDDTFVAPSHVVKVAELLGVTPIMLDKKGHFTDGDGVTKAPFIIDAWETAQAPFPTNEELAFTSLNDELKNAGIDMAVNPKTNASPLRDDAYTIKETDNGMETMYEDIADTINTSSAKAMADMLHEERGKEKERAEKKKKSTLNIVLAFLTLVFVIAGFVLVRKGRSYEPEAVIIDADQVVVPTPFRVNESILFDLSLYSSVFQTRDGLVELRSQHRVPNKTLLHIYPGLRTAGIGRLAPLEAFLEAFEIQIPPSLSEALGKDFTYGIYGSNLGEESFILMEIESIDRVFVGMQNWEPTMASDLLHVLNIPDNVQQPSLYDRTFSEELLLNTPMRVLRAPTVTKQITTETVEKYFDEPIKHSLPQQTLAAITDITDGEIIFGQPDAFLNDLAIGDVITAGSNSFGDPFVRVIDNFIRTEDAFKIITQTINLSDLTPTIPEGGRLVLKPDDNGALRKFVQYDQEVTTYVEGFEVPVLYHTFIGNKYVLVSTGIDAIETILTRLGESGNS